MAVLPKMDKAIKRFEPTNTKDIYECVISVYMYNNLLNIRKAVID